MKTSQYFERKEDFAELTTDIANWLAHDESVERVYAKHKRIKVTIENPESKRKKAANDFYWGVIVKGFMGPEVWPDYTKDEVHLTLRESFCTTRKPQAVIDKEIEDGRHKTEWYVPSSSDDTIHAFWVYCEKCINGLFEAGGRLDVADQREYQEVKEMFRT